MLAGVEIFFLQEREELRGERDHLQSNCCKYKEDLTKEAEFRKEMEATWNRLGVEYRDHVDSLTNQVKVAEESLDKIGGLYRTLKEGGRRDLHKLSVDRTKIISELHRLQDENDNLVGKHSALASSLANEMINLPNSQEEMQLLLLTYREELITAKIAKERAEEKMNNEVGFMRNQLASEQQQRMALETNVNKDFQALQEKIRSMEPASEALDGERQKRRALEHRLEDLQARSNVAVVESTKQMESVKLDRESAVAHVSNLKAKVASLQTDLDNSVAVQNDFVRLSQSLQVELEKIRQSEKEVRWQHEDDIADCNACRAGFGKQRRKLHCKHCGRIFCQDCLTKQVLTP